MNTLFKKIICIILSGVFACSTLVGPSYANSVISSQWSVTSLPQPGQMVGLSQSFEPVLLSGVKVNPDNPFQFDFLIDSGQKKTQEHKDTGTQNKEQTMDNRLSTVNGQLSKDAKRLIKYFLAALTTPEQDFWVNLSPYEKDRIVPDNFGKTEMGRDLLAQDYLLKQITASLIYPESESGKQFWDQVYKKAYEKYGITDISRDTFNKVWIVPKKAVVYEGDGVAYVTEASLKVMVDEDYRDTSYEVRSTNGEQSVNQDRTTYNVERTTKNNDISTDIMRKVIIPILEKEVNQGAHFAPLRQIYHSLILATWYKQKLKDSLLAQVYADQKKVEGLSYKTHDTGHMTQDNKEYEAGSKKKNLQVNLATSNQQPATIENIYNQYLEAFRKGVFNYIKEEYDQASQQQIPRKYFSGGKDFAQISKIVEIEDYPREISENDAAMVSVNLARESKKSIQDLAMNTKQNIPLVKSWQQIPELLRDVEPQNIFEVINPEQKQYHGVAGENIIKRILSNQIISEDETSGGRWASIGILNDPISWATNNGEQGVYGMMFEIPKSVAQQRYDDQFQIQGLVPLSEISRAWIVTVAEGEGKFLHRVKMVEISLSTMSDTKTLSSNTVLNGEKVSADSIQVGKKIFPEHLNHQSIEVLEIRKNKVRVNMRNNEDSKVGWLDLQRVLDVLNQDTYPGQYMDFSDAVAELTDSLDVAMITASFATQQAILDTPPQEIRKFLTSHERIEFMDLPIHEQGEELHFFSAQWKELARILEQKDQKYLTFAWHVTPYQNIESISKQGLKANGNASFFFFNLNSLSNQKIVSNGKVLFSLANRILSEDRSGDHAYDHIKGSEDHGVVLFFTQDVQGEGDSIEDFGVDGIPGEWGKFSFSAYPNRTLPADNIHVVDMRVSEDELVRFRKEYERIYSDNSVLIDEIYLKAAWLDQLIKWAQDLPDAAMTSANLVASSALSGLTKELEVFKKRVEAAGEVKGTSYFQGVHSYNLVKGKKWIDIIPSSIDKELILYRHWKEKDYLAKGYSQEIVELQVAWKEFDLRNPKLSKKMDGGETGKATTWWRTSLDQVRLMVDKFDLDSEDVIADLGSSDGSVAMYFALLTGAKVIGVELDRNRYEYATKFLEFLKTEKSHLVDVSRVSFVNENWINYKFKGVTFAHSYVDFHPRASQMKRKDMNGTAERILKKLNQNLPVGSRAYFSNLFELPEVDQKELKKLKSTMRGLRMRRLGFGGLTGVYGVLISKPEDAAMVSVDLNRENKKDLDDKATKVKEVSFKSEDFNVGRLENENVLFSEHVQPYHLSLWSDKPDEDEDSLIRRMGLDNLASLEQALDLDALIIYLSDNARQTQVEVVVSSFTSDGKKVFRVLIHQNQTKVSDFEKIEINHKGYLSRGLSYLEDISARESDGGIGLGGDGLAYIGRFLQANAAKISYRMNADQPYALTTEVLLVEDAAMASSLKGGVDLTSKQLNLQVQGAGNMATFNLDPAMVSEIRANTAGFTPVITNIVPMTIRMFLGLNEEQDKLTDLG